MKPVTNESVRARLSHLEGLNARRVGTAVEQQQFELACLRKLLTLLESQSLTAQQPDPTYLRALEINISDAECEEIKAALRNLKTAAPQPFHTIMSPAPTVPEIVPESLRDEIIDLCAGYEIGDQGAQEIWETCRAAMLQVVDGNPPVIPDGLRLALSNAGIAAPESDEMLAATCEKHIQALVTWVKDRKPFRPAPVSLPDEMYWQDAPVEGSTHAAAYATGWNACRAVMLNGGKP